MYYLKLKENIYELPCTQLYIDEFSNYIKDNVIELDNLKENELSEVLDKLYFRICMIFCAVEGNQTEEEMEIRMEINRVSPLKKFLKSKGNILKSNELAETVIEKILTYNKEMNNDDIKKR